MAGRKKKNGFLAKLMRNYKQPEDVWHKLSFKAEDTRKLAHYMLDWMIDNKEEISFQGFGIKHQITIKEIKEMAASSSYFNKAYELSRMIITTRIRKGWNEKILDRSFAKHQLQIFDDEFREVMESQYRIKSELAMATNRAEADGKNLQVVMYNYDDKEEPVEKEKGAEA